VNSVDWCEWRYLSWLTKWRTNERE
jgi:hypothetical protein